MMDDEDRALLLPNCVVCKVSIRSSLKVSVCGCLLHDECDGNWRGCPGCAATVAQRTAPFRLYLDPLQLLRSVSEAALKEGQEDVGSDDEQADGPEVQAAGVRAQEQLEAAQRARDEARNGLRSIEQAAQAQRQEAEALEDALERIRMQRAAAQARYSTLASENEKMEKSLRKESHTGRQLDQDLLRMSEEIRQHPLMMDLQRVLVDAPAQRGRQDSKSQDQINFLRKSIVDDLVKHISASAQRDEDVRHYRRRLEIAGEEFKAVRQDLDRDQLELQELRAEVDDRQRAYTEAHNQRLELVAQLDPLEKEIAELRRQLRQSQAAESIEQEADLPPPAVLTPHIAMRQEIMGRAAPPPPPSVGMFPARRAPVSAPALSTPSTAQIFKRSSSNDGVSASSSHSGGQRSRGEDSSRQPAALSRLMALNQQERGDRHVSSESRGASGNSLKRKLAERDGPGVRPPPLSAASAASSSSSSRSWSSPVLPAPDSASAAAPAPRNPRQRSHTAQDAEERMQNAFSFFDRLDARQPAPKPSLASVLAPPLPAANRFSDSLASNRQSKKPKQRSFSFLN